MLFAIDFSDSFAIFLIIWLVVLAVLWVRELWRIKTYEWEICKRQLFSCDKCHLAFIERSAVNLTRCPRCNSICIHRRRK